MDPVIFFFDLNHEKRGDREGYYTRGEVGEGDISKDLFNLNLGLRDPIRFTD